MGMEYAAIHGLSPENPYSTIVESTWSAIKQWDINVIRIPLNSVSYLGLKCVTPFTGPTYNKPGKIQEADPGHNYRQRLREVVDRATSENLYVILDLHFSGPDDKKNAVEGITTQCPIDMNPLPDLDHSIDFWKELAVEYKSYPNVMFELFNNPYIDNWPYFNGDKHEAWRALRDGAEVNLYRPMWPTPEKHIWKSVGLQQLVNTIRNTGAKNVILQGAISYSADLELWLQYRSIDPLNQTAAVWHAFPPTDVDESDKCYNYPGTWCDGRAYIYAKAIIDANFPVIVTEFGERKSDDSFDAPFVAALMPQLDSMSISYLAWTFTEARQINFQLIRDNIGTPTNGYGTYIKSHYNCLAANKPKCLELESKSSQANDDVVENTPKADTQGWSTLSPPL